MPGRREAAGRVDRGHARERPGLAVREGAKDSKGRAIDHGFAERSTFIVTPDRKVVMTIANVAPVANVEQALQAVQGLAKK